MFRGGPVSFLLTCELTFRSRRCDPVDFAFGCLSGVPATSASSYYWTP